jgi:hypothetical protein
LALLTSIVLLKVNSSILQFGLLVEGKKAYPERWAKSGRDGTLPSGSVWQQTVFWKNRGINAGGD